MKFIKFFITALLISIGAKAQSSIKPGSYKCSKGEVVEVEKDNYGYTITYYSTLKASLGERASFRGTVIVPFNQNLSITQLEQADTRAESIQTELDDSEYGLIVKSNNSFKLIVKSFTMDTFTNDTNSALKRYNFYWSTLRFIDEQDTFDCTIKTSIPRPH